MPVVLAILSSNHAFTKVKAGEYWITRDQNPFKSTRLLLVKEIKCDWVLYDEILVKTGEVLYPDNSMKLDSFKRLYKKYYEKEKD